MRRWSAVAACGDDSTTTSGVVGTSGSSAPTPTSTPSGQIQTNPANATVALKIGSKNFTEQRILGEIYAQGLAAAGYNTSTDLNLVDEHTALKALKGGQIDAYPEYTGTALLSFFNTAAAELPEDPQQAYELAKSRLRARRASPRSRRRRSRTPTRSR